MESAPQPKSQEPWSPFDRAMGMAGLAVIVLFALYLGYAIQANWSGAANWSKARADLKGAGISIDAKDYLPAPVPAAQDFGALPLFQFSIDPSTGRPTLDAMHKALDPFLDTIYYPKSEKYSPGKIPDLGSWQRNGGTDLAEVRDKLAESCRVHAPPIPVPAGAAPTEILGLICPTFAELRAQNATRPQCRFDLGFSGGYPRNADKIVEFAGRQIALANALGYEEVLAVLDGHPQLALDDLKVGWKIEAGVRQVPSVTAGLVYIGLLAIHRGVIQEGLNRHVWNDAQLKEVDDGLGQADLLAEAQFFERSDFAVYEIPLVEEFKKDTNFGVHESRRMSKEYGMPVKESYYFWMTLLAWVTPKGQYDDGLANYASYLLPGHKQLLDVASRRAFPDHEVDFPPKRERDFGPSPPEDIFRSAGEKFAESQVQNDEARIACRLERYRLVHGAYPASLESLEAEYSPLPHDIINGEPYHYKRTDDGTYLLYSVGWNQKDDGGDAGTRQQSGTEKPDWVWTNAPEKK